MDDSTPYYLLYQLFHAVERVSLLVPRLAHPLKKATLALSAHDEELNNADEARS